MVDGPAGPRIDEAAERRWERAEDDACAVQRLLTLAGINQDGRRIYADSLEAVVHETEDERGPVFFSAVESLTLQVRAIEDCFGTPQEMAGSIAAELRRWADRIDEQCRTRKEKSAD